MDVAYDLQMLLSINNANKILVRLLEYDRWQAQQLKIYDNFINLLQFKIDKNMREFMWIVYYNKLSHFAISITVTYSFIQYLFRAYCRRVEQCLMQYHIH